VTTATLIETSPRAAGWQRIFGRLNNVPLTSSRLHLVRHQTEGLMYVYELDISALTPEERERLIDLLAEEFNLPRSEVASDVDEQGVPIRAEDVLLDRPPVGVAPNFIFLDESVDWQDDNCGWDGEDDDDDI